MYVYVSYRAGCTTDTAETGELVKSKQREQRSWPLARLLDAHQRVVFLSEGATGTQGSPSLPSARPSPGPRNVQHRTQHRRPQSLGRLIVTLPRPRTHNSERSGETGEAPTPIKDHRRHGSASVKNTFKETTETGFRFMGL